MARKNEMTDLGDVVEVMEVTDTLRGKSFCCSGHLGKPRKEIHKMIVQAGGEVMSSSGLGYGYLITNADFNKGAVSGKKSSKILKAERNGTKIITEKEFYDMLIGENG